MVVTSTTTPSRLFEQPPPLLVAAVQGAAIGAGLGLAVAADFRVAAPEAPFRRQLRPALGFHHGFALSVTLPRVVGVHQATRILLEARRMTGDAAADIGLVDELVAEEDLAEASRAMAAGIAAQAPLAIRSIRATLRGDLAERAEQAMRWERLEQERLSMTSDFAEGVAAMADRRRPQFTNR